MEKKKLSILVLCLLLFLSFIGLQAQNTDDWITPIADIEFGENKMIYSYSADECVTFERIKPVHYSSTVLDVNGVLGAGCISDYKDMYSQIYSYVDEWHYSIACNMDKYNFLKSAGLLTMWNIGNRDFLPANTLEILGYLENDMSIEISENTKLVLNLYNYYNEK